ncbi:hypothetical protein BH09ACT3_BH09ACT3_05300 [soil metagenome]
MPTLGLSVPDEQEETSTVAAEAERSAAGAAASALSDFDQRVLAFERQWWKHAGAKEDAIRAEFGLSTARYYQVLNAVLDLPAALVFDPMLVKRLQRIRDARTGARSARTFGDPDRPVSH